MKSFIKPNLEEKLQVVFHEYNILNNGSVYLPLVSGSLQAHAQTDSIITENFRFEPFKFYRENPNKIMEKVENPAISAFSVSMWNANLSFEIAKRTKEKYPNSLIVFGGPHVPFDTMLLPQESERFFSEHPYIDITVRSDGEQIFSDILKKSLETKTDFEDIEGISYRGSDGKVISTLDRDPEKDLDVFATPYKDGGPFDDLIRDNSNIDFQAIIETNRGCPFSCSFCFWGEAGKERLKIREFSLERIEEILDWIGRNKIDYMYDGAANFGMYKRDIDIAKIVVDTKERLGFPERYRVCYGKNKPDRVFEVAKILSESNMAKGVTLSRQSSHAQTLKNIRRSNIKLTAYDDLQKKYAEEGISTYTEMILGLPGETKQSFLDGLEGVLEGSRIGQLYVYHCQVFPNTQLNDPIYQHKHGIRTKEFPLQEIHGIVRKEEGVEEIEEIVISTNSMPSKDWRESAVNAWVSQTMHSLKAGYHISNYLWVEHGIKYVDFYEHIAQNKMNSETSPMITKEINDLHNLARKIQEGHTRAQIVPEFGDVTWEPEEASYLRFVKDTSTFYNELFKITKDFLVESRREFNEDEMREVFKYQEVLIPRFPNPGQIIFDFKYNVPEYMDSFFDNDRPKLSRTAQTLEIVEGKDFGNDNSRYARETVLWGRRSNSILYNFIWSKK